MAVGISKGLGLAVDSGSDLGKALAFVRDVAQRHVLEHGSAGILRENGKTVSSVVHGVLHLEKRVLYRKWVKGGGCLLARK